MLSSATLGKLFKWRTSVTEQWAMDDALQLVGLMSHWPPIIDMCSFQLWAQGLDGYEHCLCSLVRYGKHKLYLFMPISLLGGAVMHWWPLSFCLCVSLSVHLSVCPVPDPKFRTEWRKKLKIGRKEDHDTGDPSSNLEVEWWKVKVTRPINAVTKYQPYLWNRKAYELQTWCTDGVRWTTYIIDMHQGFKCQDYQAV